ncbi:killer cell lectin-like receptor subfamily F member 1, partial [Biomphalaria pfeifferi]
NVKKQLVSTENDVNVTCQEGWTKLHRGCYKFVKEETTWTDAVEKCQSDNAELSALLSESEKDDVQQYFISNDEIKDKRWWVGLTREKNTGSKWIWTDKDLTQIDTKITPWFQNSQSTKPGELSATIELNSGRLVLRSDFRDDQEVIYPFICEFHKVSQRVSYATTTFQPPDLKEAIQTSDEPDNEPSYVQRDYATPAPQEPAVTPQTATESSPCAVDSDNTDYGRVIRRLHSADDPLYKQYLQSEINANVAKMAYYTRVAGLYEAALQQQNQYYESSREKLRLEIDRLNQPLTCT